MNILRPFNILRSSLTVIMTPLKMIGSMFRKTGKFKIPPWVRYGMHFILLALLVGVLVYLNLSFEWYVQIVAPKYVQLTWPALVALLIYAAIRLVLYIIAQIPAAQTDFPDIEEAMEEGIAALASANLSLRDVPLFLVVGLSPEEERCFASSPIVGREIQVNDSDLPVHWYGDRRGIWVTLPGISAIVAQNKMSESRGGPVPDEPLPDFGETGGSELARFSTLAGAGRFATIAGEAPESTAGAPLVEGYHAPARRLDADERDRLEARMHFFVRLLREERYPVCPANGILTAVPFYWTTSPGLSQLADTVKIDMHALQQSLGIKGLCLLTFTGIEQFSEFRAYIQRLDRDQVERRCGCGYPSLISPSTEDADRTHAWLVQYFERQVFELFQRKLGDNTNGELFRLLDRFRKSRQNVIRILKNAFPDDVDEPMYLGGVYFSSLSNAGEVHRPFFDGLLARMAREHDDTIGWNDAAIREDRAMLGLSKWILVAAAVFVIVDALLVLSMFVPLGIG